MSLYEGRRTKAETILQFFYSISCCKHCPHQFLSIKFLHCPYSTAAK